MAWSTAVLPASLGPDRQGLGVLNVEPAGFPDTSVVLDPSRDKPHR